MMPVPAEVKRARVGHLQLELLALLSVEERSRGATVGELHQLAGSTDPRNARESLKLLERRGLVAKRPGRRLPPLPRGGHRRTVWQITAQGLGELCDLLCDGRVPGLHEWEVDELEAG